MNSPSDEFKRQLVVLVFVVAGTVATAVLSSPDSGKTIKMWTTRKFATVCDRTALALLNAADKGYQAYEKECN